MNRLPVQVLPGRTITTVSHGLDHNGFPFVLVASAEGDIITLTADGYSVDPELVLKVIQKGTD